MASGRRRQRPALCLLKLHGAICYARARKQINHEVFFESDAKTRLPQLFDPEIFHDVPPLMFPWELINPGLDFVPQEEFPLGRHYGLFKKIWQRAKREVQRADKISFVGLSMHQFLNFGLQFLFTGKTNRAVHFVSVNPSNETRQNHDKPSHDPTTPAGRLRSFLQSMGQWDRPPGVQSKHYEGEGQGESCITTLKTFEQFIAEQMP